MAATIRAVSAAGSSFRTEAEKASASRRDEAVPVIDAPGASMRLHGGGLKIQTVDSDGPIGSWPRSRGRPGNANFGLYSACDAQCESIRSAGNGVRASHGRGAAAGPEQPGGPRT